MYWLLVKCYGLSTPTTATLQRSQWVALRSTQYRFRIDISLKDIDEFMNNEGIINYQESMYNAEML